MKKALSVILVAAIVIVMVACAKKDNADKTETQAVTEAAAQEAATEEVTETAAQPETEAVKEEPVGMINPMVEIDDDKEFESQLGIKIDTKQIMAKTKLFIINKNLAHITWTQPNVENEEVEFTLRATKNAELGPTCHGIQGELTKINDIEIQGVNGPVTITVSSQGNYTIYTWKVGDTFYSLTYDKSMSQMAMAEVLDQVMFATGTMAWTKSVVPLPYEVDVDNIADGIYTVLVEKDGIKEADGKYTMDCEVYAKELFDVVDVHTLNPGDTVTIGGDMVVTVDTVEEKDGEIIINGGDEGDGGCILSPGEGGTYFYRGFNDHPSFSYIGKVTVEIADDVVLTDTSNIEDGCKEVVVTGAKDVADYLAKSVYARLTPASGSIRTENKKVVEIKTWYTP